MPRPYQQHTIEQLETLVRKHAHELATMGDVRAELTYRSTARAQLLLRQVEAMNSGVINRPPGPPRPDDPDDQGELL